MVKSACGIEAVYMCFNGTGIWGGETIYCGIDFKMTDMRSWLKILTIILTINHRTLHFSAINTPRSRLL